MTVPVEDVKNSSAWDLEIPKMISTGNAVIVQHGGNNYTFTPRNTSHIENPVLRQFMENVAYNMTADGNDTVSNVINQVHDIAEVTDEAVQTLDQFLKSPAYNFTKRAYEAVGGMAGLSSALATTGAAMNAAGQTLQLFLPSALGQALSLAGYTFTLVGDAGARYWSVSPGVPQQVVNAAQQGQNVLHSSVPLTPTPSRPVPIPSPTPHVAHRTRSKTRPSSNNQRVNRALAFP